MKRNQHGLPFFVWITSPSALLGILLLAVAEHVFFFATTSRSYCHGFVLLHTTSTRRSIKTITTTSGRSWPNASPGPVLAVLGMAGGAAAAAAAALAPSTAEDRAAARALILQGMEAFRRGDVTGSIQYLDRAERVQGPSLTPYLWQRGISYYYANDFGLASRQFRTDVQVNPSDVEEIVWDIASQLRMMNPAAQQFPVPNQMSLPSGMRDRRRIMPTVYRLFRGEATEHELAVAGHSIGASIADEFYALFYLGLFCEARGETSKAALYMQQAAATEYATGVGRGDYMTACARVHCNLRGWTPNADR